MLVNQLSDPFEEMVNNVKNNNNYNVETNNISLFYFEEEMGNP